MFRNKITAFLLVLFSMLSLAATVSAMSDEDRKNFMNMSEQERKFLLMYFDEDELFVVSATRSLKSIDRIAENVEIVTAADIELMNAHTVADVLKTVNGVQVYFSGASPISIANATIQSSNFEHVAYFLDGVPLRFLNDNMTIASDIPVQMIEKIEIIKGPASSAWGSSLGGVVNIITKSPGAKEKVSGTLSASLGEKATTDLRAEIYGRKDKFGYYLTAGRLGTDGLRAEEEGGHNNLYTKLSYDLSSDTSLLFTLGYNRVNRERSDTSVLDWLDSDKFERFYSTLSLNSSMNKELDLNILLRAMRQKIDVFEKTVSTGESILYGRDKENLYGASAKLNWRHAAHNIVFGADYDDGKVETDIYSSDLRRWAVYANDTITIGKLAVTPGIRYDDATNHDGFLSPSLGLTYELFDKTLLRGVVSRGFNAPSILNTVADWGNFIHNPDLKVEQVVSYQAGIETGMLKYVWLKVTGFRHDIKDGIVGECIDEFCGTWTYRNRDKIRRQGLEFELKTIPVFNTTLSAGASFIETKDRNSGEELKDNAKNTYDIGLRYDDKKSFAALLQGHYIWFNDTGTYHPKDKTFIFDLNMIKKIYKNDDNALEVFLTWHNIFNDPQYFAMFYRNAGRWIEAGIRCKF